jgi:RNA polymerase sigma-70 factor (ECF subfamily)
MPTLSDQTDHELMVQTGKSSPEPLAILFDRHHVRLFNFFRKLGHSRPASEDLVQDTFLRMLRFAAGYRDTGRFMAWMYQIARHAAADAGGKHSRAPTCETELDELPGDASTDPERQHELHDTEQRLLRALQRLPPERRELVLLSRVKELTTEDLARLFDCSSAAVKVRLHRSLQQLREHFADDQAPGSRHQLRERR